MPQPPTRLKRGDTLPIFDAILRDAMGDPIDLQAGDTVALFMRQAGPPRAAKISGAACIIVAPGALPDDPDRGRITYAWVPADTDTPGKFELEVRLTLAGGGVETFPNAGAHPVDVVQEMG